MKTTIRNRATHLSLLGASLFLGACNQTEPGVDDYQNSVVDARTAGKSLAGSFEQGKGWDAAVSAPAAPAFNFSTQTQVLRKSTAMPKADLGADFEINLDDTAKGYATVTLTTIGLLMTTHDTAVVKWDANSKDTVKDNENIISYQRVARHIGGKVEILSIKDADDNGQVTPVAGVNNKARFLFTTVHLGITETADLVVGSGPDNDFDLEGDNTVYQALWTKVKAGVTLSKGEFLDADGDGKVGDNASDQICLARWFELNPVGKPFVKKATAEAKLKVFKNKAGDEPISFSATEELITGRVNAVSMKNREGGADIIKGDTMWVKIETTRSSDDDTLQHSEIVIVMNPGQDLKSEDDDLCYAIHVKTQKRFGFERSAEFNFVSAAPIPHGKEPAAGSFDGKATYANGKTATLKGSFSPAGFQAEYTGPEGNTVSVEFTKSGDVI